MNPSTNPSTSLPEGASIDPPAASTAGEPARPALDDAARDRLYRRCCQAISEAGRVRESLLLARLVLLLFEQVGDAERCAAAIDEAARDLPLPSLSREA